MGPVIRYLPILVALITVLPTSGGLAQTTDQEQAAAGAAEGENQARWPRVVSNEAGSVTIHTPEIESWEDFSSMVARAAIEVVPEGESEPVLGVAAFTAETDINLEKRLVSVEKIVITSSRFSGLAEERDAELDTVLREVVQPVDHLIPLDVLLSYVAEDIPIENVAGLSYEAPPIFHSFSPAYLLQTDGEPLLASIENTDLQFVLNTNWDLFRYKDSEWFMRVGQNWLRNEGDGLDGKWEWVSRLPGDFKDLPDEDNWRDARAAVPAEEASGSVPTIFVSERPAELILIDRAASVRPVGGPGLEYVTTTESDLFRYERIYYYLVSGRWFTATRLDGPWKFTAELPEAFLEIPEDHEKGHVLAAIPGTFAATSAAIEAQIPVKATIKRDAGNEITVNYAGDPEFEAIEGTEVQRAVNSPADVFLIDDAYYLCSSGAWYIAAAAGGPWSITDTIPAAIYTIPPSSSSYHVTHVHVYESDNDTVTTGYTGGYVGTSVSFGVVMYGTGWYYPPYYYYPPYGRYPFYYPYPYSFGSSAWYNPSTGRYGRTASVYGPYGGYGRSASYNPSTGSYTRGAAVWDHDEIAASGIGYNPRTGTGVATNRYVNEDGGWGESIVRRDDKWVQTESQWSGDSRTTQFETSEGGSGQVDRTVDGDNVHREGQFEKDGQTLNTESVRGEQGAVGRIESGSGEEVKLARAEGGDLYAGKDGEVYRRTEDGWEKHDGGGWGSVDRADQQVGTANQQASAENRSREAGTQAQSRQAGTGLDRGVATQQSRVDGGGFASTSQYRQFGSSYESNSARTQDLNRSYSARSSGYNRYNNYQGSYQPASPSTRQMPRRSRRR